MQISKQIILTSIICLAVVGGVSAVSAWTGPTAAPPGGNTSAPINVSDTAQYKSGAFGVGGILRGYGNVIFDGNVGIGTDTPSFKLSILGSLGLLRDPSTATNPGPGPEIFLQSPSTNVSPSNTGWVSCGAGFPSPCPAETVPTKNLTNEYTCVGADGGKTYIDVRKIGIPPNDYYQSTNLTCISGTDKYSLRTNSGILEFLNNSNALKMSLGQDGDMWVSGKITAPQFCIGTDCKTAWPSSGTGGTTYTAGSGISIIDSIISVKSAGCTSGQVLQRNSGNTDWVCASVASGGGITAETDPTVSGWAKATDDSKYLNTTADSQIKSGALGVEGVLRGYSDAFFSGDVGIGTGGPNEKLEVKDGNIFIFGDAPTNNGLRLQYGAGNSFWINTPAGDRMEIGGTGSTSPSQGAITIRGGNVGIGTPNPGTYKLNVAGDIRGNSADIPEINTNNLIATNNISINNGVLTLRPGSADISKGKKPSETVWRISWSDFNNWDFESTQTDTCSTDTDKDTKDFTCTGYNIVGPCYDRATVIIGTTDYGYATRQLQCFATSGVYVIKNEGNTLKFISGNGTAKMSIGQDGIATFNNQVEITGGSPGVGKVLTSSNDTGLATWASLPAGLWTAVGYANAYYNKTGNVAIGTNVVDTFAKLSLLNDFSDNILKLQRKGSVFVYDTNFKLGIDSALVINNGGKDTLTLKDGNVKINNLIKTGIPSAVYANDRSLCAGADGSVVFCYLLNKPIITFSVDNSQIKESSATTLRWSAVQTSSCTASGGWSGVKDAVGTEVVTPLKTTDYIISCTNSFGESTASVKVRVYGWSYMNFGEKGSLGESCQTWLGRRGDVMVSWGTSCNKWGHGDTAVADNCAYERARVEDACYSSDWSDPNYFPQSGIAQEWASHTAAWLERK